VQPTHPLKPQERQSRAERCGPRLVAFDFRDRKRYLNVRDQLF